MMPGHDPKRQAAASEVIEKVGCGRLLFLLVIGPLLPFVAFFVAGRLWNDETALAAGGLALVLFALYVLFLERPRLERLFRDE